MRINLKSESGVGLIEVLIASAIVGVVAMAFTGLLSTMQSGVNNVKFRSDADVANEEIRALLSDPEACRNSFGGLAATAGASHAIALLKKHDNTNSPYAANAILGDNSVTLRTMRLKSFQAGPTANAGQMTLVNDMLTKKEASGSQVVSREIHIGLVLAGSNISTCVALAKMSDGIWQRTPTNLNNIFFATPVIIPPSPSGGRVGIGTGTPTTLLEVSQYGTGAIAPDFPVVRVRNPNVGGDSLAALQAWAGDGLVQGGLSASTNGGDPVLNLSTSTATPLVFATGNSSGAAIEQMRIMPNGMVAIGVSMPVLGTAAASVAQGTMQIHSRQYQGALFISGAGDGNETYSSLNLMADHPTAGWNETWTIAHKKAPSAALTHAFQIAHWRSINSMTYPFTIMGSDDLVQIQGDRLGGVLRVANLRAGTAHAIEFGENLAQVGGNVAGAFLSAGSSVFRLGSMATLSVSLQVNGTVSATSDARLKKNFAPLDGLALARQLRGVRFNWRETGEPDVGFVAQEVEKILPELVVTGADGTKALKYGNITAVLAQAVKELDEENRELKKKIDQLSERVGALEKK